MEQVPSPSDDGVQKIPVHERFPTLASWDLWVGLVAGPACGLVTALSAAVRGNGFTIALAAVGVDIAILGVVLVTMQLFLALLDADFALAIDNAGGLDDATRPYLTVAKVAGVGALVAIIGAICWAVAPWWGAALIIGATVLLAAWAIAGTVQLVELSLFFSDKRGRLSLAEAKARALRRKPA
jgi:hypothetical protein